MGTGVKALDCGKVGAPFLRIIALISIMVIIIYFTGRYAHCDQVKPSEEKLIGNVIIDRIPIFDVSKEEENKPIFRFVNRLHFITKESVIRRELLFREGNKLDEELLKESERNLRALEIFRHVEVKKESRDNREDIYVKIQDAWTTAILLGMGGINRLRLTLAGIEEKNLLGYDKYISIRYNRTEERKYYIFSYRDPRTLGYFLDLNATYSKLSDGRTSSVSLIRPFYSLGTDWSAGVSTMDQKLNLPIYREGEKAYELKNTERRFELFYNHLLYHDKDVLYRIKGFYRYDEDKFLPKDYVPRENIPENRRISAPGIGFQRMGIDYIKADHINKFERKEDFNLGNDFSLSIGFSSESLGARDDGIIFNSLHLFGFRGMGSSFGLSALSLDFRSSGSQMRNALGSIDLRYFERSFPRQTLVFHFNVTGGWKLDKDVQLTLGSDNGLRGYHTNQFTGNKKLLFNIEDRIFIKDDFLHIVSIGLAPFFDMGYVWEKGEGMDISDLKASVGIGLRFGFTRSSIGTVTRFDVSYTLNNPGRGRDRWIFLISTLPPF